MNSTRTELSALIKLAWPAAISNLQWIALNFIDTAMVGHAGPNELAYMGAGRILTWITMMVGIGFLSGVSVFTGRAVGADNEKNCGRVLMQGLQFAVLLGIINMAMLMMLTRPLLELAKQQQEVIAGGVRFANMIAWLSIPQFMLVAISAFLQGISRPKIAMMISFIALPVNVALNAIFIFGKFGWPVMGASGAALGTVLSDILVVVMLLWVVARLKDKARYGIYWTFKGAWAAGKAMRRFGLAPAIAGGLENAGFSVLTAIAGTISIAAAAAYQDVMAVLIAGLSISLGVASAVSVRISMAVGAGDKRAVAGRGWIACALTAATLLPVILVFLAQPEWFFSALSNDTAQLKVAVVMMTIIAPFMIFDGSQFVLLYALRAAGDQVMAAAVQISGYCLMMIACVWTGVYVLHLGAAGIGWGMGAGMVTTFCLMAARFWWVCDDPPALRAGYEPEGLAKATIE